MTALFEDMMEGLDSVEAYLKGDREGFKIHVPAEIDVRKIRGGLKMTQGDFARSFGFSLDAVKHWEGGRRTPEAAARAFLTVISRNPGAVLSALKMETSGTSSAGTKRKRRLSVEASGVRRGPAAPRKRAAA